MQYQTLRERRKREKMTLSVTVSSDITKYFGVMLLAALSPVSTCSIKSYKCNSLESWMHCANT